MSASPTSDTEDKAPPPPPPPSDPQSKISPYVSKLRSATHSFYEPPKSQPTTALTGPYFFYGTLTDPSMIAEILGLAKEPKLRPAVISGYQCKMWGQYPALVDAPDSMVEGAVYIVETVEDGEKLATYETKNYRPESCVIQYTDSQEPTRDLGFAFKFVGNPHDLSEGTFDLRSWLRMMRRQEAVEKLDARKREA